jgi:hypothetical protein
MGETDDFFKGEPSYHFLGVPVYVSDNIPTNEIWFIQRDNIIVKVCNIGDDNGKG